MTLRFSLRWLLALLAGSATAHAADRGLAVSPAEARQEIAALRSQLAELDERYHRDDTPAASDADYDRWKRRLRDLEQAFPALAADAGGAVPEIGDDRSGRFETRRHRERMLSLDKVYSQAELAAFHARLAKRLGRTDLEFVIEPKFDGFAVSATYERGRLVRAVTRGNGTEGDDITANVLKIAGLPRELKGTPVPDLIELRGEIYVSFADFAHINAEQEEAGEPLFANPRNLAAGTIRQLDAREVAHRRLAVVFFGLGACEPASVRPESQQAFHAALARWGLPRMERFWTARGPGEVWRAVEEIGRLRPGLAFPTDGAVVKLDVVALQQRLGASDSAPHWAVAYKFAPESVETEVRAIAIQVGRTGVLTPVAELAPVKLGGATVTRATLHNRAALARKDVRIGDWVVLEKAGDVVPAIASVNRTRRPAGAKAFEFPDVCPECAAEVVEEGEATVRCPNPSCPAQLRRRLEHFASKDGVDIKGLGPATIAGLLEKGAVKSLPDLYRLRREDLAIPGREADKSFDRLLAEIEASRRADLWRVLAGLGVPQVGAVGAKELARRYGSLEALMTASPDDLNRDAPGRAMARFLAEANGRKIVEGLMAARAANPSRAGP